MTIVIRKPVFAHPPVDFRQADRSHSIRQAPSYLGMGRPAQNKAGQS